VVSKSGREQVADRDIARLRPRQWLNDEIINFYGGLLLSRSESRRKDSIPTLADGRINGLVNGIKAKAKAKATEKKPPLDVHYFNTFFWPKLTGEGYDKGRLAKWTKKVTFGSNTSVHGTYSFLAFASSTYSQRM
jgi:sentrin-specific protease 1